MAWAEPTAPVEISVAPMRDSNGRARSRSAASPPAMMASVPAAASHGAGYRRVDQRQPGRAQQRRQPQRLRGIGRAHVQQQGARSSAIKPGRPRAPSITALVTALSGSMVMTMSQPASSSRPRPAQRASPGGMRVQPRQAGRVAVMGQDPVVRVGPRQVLQHRQAHHSQSDESDFHAHAFRLSMMPFPERKAHGDATGCIFAAYAKLAGDITNDYRDRKESAMRFKLRQMEVFRAVMLTGSMNGAAKLLFVSQPAVSRLIAHAEQSLGLQLFARDKGKLTPTPEAQRLFEEVGPLFEEALRIDELARDLAARPEAR